MQAIIGPCPQAAIPARFTPRRPKDRQPASPMGNTMRDSQEKSDRRMGPPGSDTWHAMLDGAEAVLRDEGHAALTSRRIAERIGVRQRLVYYYFATMDDLVIAMFHRLSVRELERLRQTEASAQPLREIWDVCINTTDARLISQFMALAGRIEGLRKEVIHFIEQSRAIQIAALAAASNSIATKSNPVGLRWSSSLTGSQKAMDADCAPGCDFSGRCDEAGGLAVSRAGAVRAEEFRWWCKHRFLA